MEDKSWRSPVAARLTGGGGCRQILFTWGGAITPHRAAPNLRVYGRVLWLSEGRLREAAAGPCACAWASRERQSRTEAGSAGRPGAGALRAPSGTAAAEQRRALPRTSGAGLGWAGLGAAPRRARESRGTRRDSPALPGPLGAGGRSVPQGLEPGLRDGSARRNRLLLERAAGPRHQILSGGRKRGTLF